MLSMFGPISLDLYLPALPALATDLGASTSAAQLSITACLLGLATGQLVAGPLSDQFGRRPPLIVGLVVYLITSAACAFAPTIELLVVLRLLQGLGGAAGIVIARAVARDLYSGRRLVIIFSRLILVNGLAPVLAPVIGGQLALVTSWRGIFVVLAAFGIVLLAAGVFGVPESLPAERRRAGGVRDTLRSFRLLLGDRFFVAVVLAAGLAGASMFAYIAGATFVLQRLYGLSAQQFSFAFGANALGIMVLGQVGARLAHRWSPHRVMALGLLMNLLGAAGLAVTVLTGLGLPFLLVSLFVMVSALGLVFPTSTALALADHPDRAGSASSLLGLGQYLLGAVVAPLVGLAGEDTAVPLGIVAVACSLAASAIFFGVALPALRRKPIAEPDDLDGPQPPA
ncbi:multidrug effflux MFS transporter [Microlunatus spumicola]|uniref:Multidrug effflux MFS transporter n=2 Tax=Microlunatus spumicola TaxID=81499 RepID=A0ABP6XS64_9ACTN